MSLATQVNTLAARVAVEVKALRNRLISAGVGLSGGGDLTADRTLRLHPALVDELWTDWSSKADGALPTAGDEGVAITVIQAGGAATPTISGGGVVLSGSGAIYLNQPLPSGKKVRRLGASFTFPAAGTTGGEALAMCAWLNVGISPQTAHAHIAIGRANWAVQTYSAGSPVLIKSGNFFPSLDLNVEHRAEVTVYGSTMRVELPDGTYVEATDSTVGSITGLVGCWEILQTSTSATVKIVRSWADYRPDRPGPPSLTDIGQKARRAFANVFYDDSNGHLGISASAAAWADLYTPNTIGVGDCYIVNSAPTLANHAARKDYVDAQVATRAPADTAPRAVSASTTTTIDVSAAGDVDLTCTGDTAISFTGTPANGRVLVVTFLASGGTRTPSVPGTVVLATGVVSRSLAVASGGKGRFILRYSSLGTAAWTLDSAYPI